MWFEAGQHVFGFKVAEHTAAFEAWVDTGGVARSTAPTDGPVPDFVKPEFSVRALVPVQRLADFTAWQVSPSC